MKPFQRILVGLDLTPVGDDVWAEACAVARAFDAELHVVHVVPGVGPDGAGFEPAARAAEDRLAALVRGGLEAGVRVAPRAFVRPGDPATTIVARSRGLDADLIVIGASVLAAHGHVVLGSAAEQVVRDADTPVWIVHPGRSHSRFERIVAAVDPQEPRREAIHAAALVARASRGRLRLLAITPPQQADAEDAAARLVLRSAVAGTAAEALDLEVEVRHALQPATELVSLTERDRTDLLVVGESRHPGLRGLVERDTVERILRVAPCSILRVRRAPRLVTAEVA